MVMTTATNCSNTRSRISFWDRSGEPPRGKLWNLVESLLFFVRDKIARPGIGEHDADKFLPYLTTLFLFIFAMNLMKANVVLLSCREQPHRYIDQSECHRTFPNCAHVQFPSP